jgi:polyhydroxybutyrate depolymerase
MPLVLAFHGRGTDGNGPAFAQRTGFHMLAEREGFVVIFPDGIDHRWLDGGNLNDPTAPDDVKFVEAILDEERKLREFDPARIYATGFSNGGAFAQLLAIRLPGRIAAVGSAGASLAYTYLDELSLAEPFSVIMSCGTGDHFCSCEPMGFDYLMPMKSTIEALIMDSECNAVGMHTELEDEGPDDGCRFTRSLWTGCEHNTEIELLWAKGGRHNWYGHDPVGCQDVDITRLFWEFFRTHPRQVLRDPSEASAFATSRVDIGGHQNGRSDHWTADGSSGR